MALVRSCIPTFKNELCPFCFVEGLEMIQYSSYLVYDASIHGYFQADLGLQ
jgi:hypothetical protein